MVYPLLNLSFQTLFDAVADAMLLISDAWRVAGANPAAQSLLGYTQNEVTGLDVESLIPGRYQYLLRHYRAALTQSPEKMPMGSGNELSVLAKDGRELEVDLGISPIRDQGQLYLLVTFYTVSKRKLVEQELRTSEERLRLAKKAAGLSVFDLDAALDMRNLDEQLYPLLGNPNELLQFDDALAILHPKDRRIRESAIRKAINPAGNGEFNVEFRVVDPKDGAIHWLSVIGRAVFKDGRATRLLGVARNITEQKLLEKKLQDQQMETEKLFAKQIATQTVAAIAHELNQPLSALSTYSEVALQALEKETVDTTTLKHALKGCVAQSQRAGASLNELFTFLQKGQTIKSVLNINDIVKQALVITENYGYPDFNPVTHLEEAIQPVLANKTQVLKILVNLLRNAVEAMYVVDTSSAINISVHTDPTTHMAQITVADNGHGLDEDIAKKIFDPFFTTKPRGIGMGLAIARALAEANGGQLWLEPANKQGATFHLTLPFAP